MQKMHNGFLCILRIKHIREQIMDNGCGKRFAFRNILGIRCGQRPPFTVIRYPISINYYPLSVIRKGGTMLTIIIRTLLIYIIVTFAVRLMGKRQVGDMQTSELVITMIISEIASLPLENPERPLLSGIIPVLMLAAIEIIVSVVMLKSRKARGIICGHPIIIIRDGEIVEKEIERLRMSREDVYSLLRQQQCADPSGVKYGIIEPNGSLSILKKEDLPQDRIDSGDLRDELQELDAQKENNTKDGEKE